MAASAAQSKMNLIPRMTSVEVALPLPIFTATIAASGAIPLLPAAMPAAAVPWPERSLLGTIPASISPEEKTAPLRNPVGGVPERVISQSFSTRVAPLSVRNSGWVRSMPESINPMMTPLPVSPSTSSRRTGVMQALSSPERRNGDRPSEGSRYST